MVGANASDTWKVSFASTLSVVTDPSAFSRTTNVSSVTSTSVRNSCVSAAARTYGPTGRSGSHVYSASTRTRSRDLMSGRGSPVSGRICDTPSSTCSSVVA